jgi:hypothetical protein
MVRVGHVRHRARAKGCDWILDHRIPDLQLAIGGEEEQGQEMNATDFNQRESVHPADAWNYLSGGPDFTRYAPEPEHARVVGFNDPIHVSPEHWDRTCEWIDSEYERISAPSKTRGEEIAERIIRAWNDREPETGGADIEDHIARMFAGQIDAALAEQAERHAKLAMEKFGQQFSALSIAESIRAAK